jgi:hypothetical protein
LVPVIITLSPPFALPLVGLIPETVGAGLALKVKPAASVPVWLSVLVTTTSTAVALGAWAGEVQVICVALPMTTFVAALPPNVTVAPAAKLVPVIVTLSPPRLGPLVGLTLVAVGVGARLYVKPLGSVPNFVLGFVTTTATAPAAVRGGVLAVICVALVTTTLVA